MPSVLAPKLPVEFMSTELVSMCDIRSLESTSTSLYMVMPSVLAPKLPVEFMSTELVSMSLVWSASNGCHTCGLLLHLQPAFIEPKSEGYEHSSLVFDGVRMMPAVLKVAGCLTLMIDADHQCANCLQAPRS